MVILNEYNDHTIEQLCFFCSNMGIQDYPRGKAILRNEVGKNAYQLMIPHCSDVFPSSSSIQLPPENVKASFSCCRFIWAARPCICLLHCFEF